VEVVVVVAVRMLLLSISHDLGDGVKKTVLPSVNCVVEQMQLLPVPHQSLLLEVVAVLQVLRPQTVWPLLRTSGSSLSFEKVIKL
jgi:hypothetical protein